MFESYSSNSNSGLYGTISETLSQSIMTLESIYIPSFDDVTRSPVVDVARSYEASQDMPGQVLAHNPGPRRSILRQTPAQDSSRTA